jgi:hypothetical protein
VKKPRKKQGHLPADGVPASSNPRRNSIFLLLWYHECLPGTHNYLLGDFILFQTDLGITYPIEEKSAGVQCVPFLEP